MAIFRFEYTYYDISQDWIFLGPDYVNPEDFQKEVNEMVQAAADRALAKADPEDWFGWNAISDEIVVALKAKGFILIDPIKAYVTGPTIINDPHDRTSLSTEFVAKCMEHNGKVERAMSSDLGLTQ